MSAIIDKKYDLSSEATSHRLGRQASISSKINAVKSSVRERRECRNDETISKMAASLVDISKDDLSVYYDRLSHKIDDYHGVFIVFVFSSACTGWVSFFFLAMGCTNQSLKSTSVFVCLLIICVICLFITLAFKQQLGKLRLKLDATYKAMARHNKVS